LQDLEVETFDFQSFGPITRARYLIMTALGLEKHCDGGIALLTSNRLVLTDPYVYSVKLVDCVHNKVLDRLKLGSTPKDVCCLSGNRAAVTLPLNNTILILECNDRLTIVNSIAVKGVCWNIDYNSTDLVVHYRQPNKIEIVHMNSGEVKQRFQEKDDILTYALSVCTDRKNTFVYGLNHLAILRLDEDLQVQQIFHLPEVAQSTMIAVGGNQLLVCCSDKLWQLDTTIGRWSLLLGEGFMGVNSMAYCHERHILYAGVFPGNVVKRYVFP